MNFLDKINFEDIVAIGETTNNYGPYEDDWYIIIVFRNGDIFSIPFTYSTGQIVFEELNRRLNVEMTTKLGGITDWDSNILWPLNIAGKKMYIFNNVKEHNIFRILLSAMGLGRIKGEFTSEIKALINQ